MDVGIYRDLPFDQYRKIPAINISSLRQITRSPAHLKASQTSTWKTSDSKIFGTQVHAAILEPDYYANEFIVQPEEIKTRRGQKWDALVEQYTLERIVRVKDQQRLLAIQEAVWSSDDKSFLENKHNEYEVTIVFECCDVLCKARIDLLNIDGEYALDLKTTQDASERKFLRSMESYGYGYQQAFYALACHHALGFWPKTSILAVETAPPYAVQRFDITQEYINAACQAIFRWLNQYRECVFSDNWPAYQVIGKARPIQVTTDNLPYSPNPLFIGEIEDDREETEAA